MNWNLPKQRYLSDWDDPDKPPGDCWRCCIAAILQLPFDQVPHFETMTNTDPDTQRWLCERGYALLATPYKNGPQIHVPIWAGQPDPIVPIIAVGPTVRSKKENQNHAVVMIRNKLVYDPHPSEAGLLAIMQQYLVVKQFV